MIKIIFLVARWSIKNRNETCLVKYRKRKTDSFYNPFTSYLEWPTMILANSLVLCLAPDDRRNVEKGVSSTKYAAQIKRISNKWNLEWPASLSLSLSLGRPVILNILIINTTIVEPKCLCSQDWRRLQIFRNSFGKSYP